MSMKWSSTNVPPEPLSPLPGDAESRLSPAAHREGTAPSAVELLHELQLHQVELEMQNESLRRTQVALAESRDRYADLYEFASVGYLTLSSACLITEANLTGATMFGVERSKLLNRRPDAYIVAADLERWHRLFVGAIRHEGKQSFDLTLKQPNGSQREVRLDCVHKDNDDGKPTLHVSLTDITERRRAERLAERERLRLQTILQMASDGIHILDHEGLLVEANDAFLKMIGHDHMAIGKLRVTDWDAQDSWVHIKARINKVIAEHGKLNFTTRHRRRDGAVLDVEVNASWIEIDGKGYLYSAARDITERTRHEHLLEERNIELESARKAADKANQAKSDFLSSMSHELRTPLNAVLGFAQLMEAGTPAPSAAQKPKIDQILKAGWHLLTLINEILDLAKIEAGKVTMLREAMSLSDVLQDCQAMIEPQASQRGVTVAFPSLDNPLYVLGDPTGIKQVMVNLLSNAIKYNRVGGTVSVRCAATGDNRLRVSVKDNGVGLAPEQLAQLFQPFNRLGQENGVEEGTGIGLVVTRQLVELMGGVIGVQSRAGAGSTFWFELAASEMPDAVSERLRETVLDIRAEAAKREFMLQRTLLYVEDNPANLALVEELIARRSDLKLLTATDGHQGVQMARDFQPDVILMDLNLPGISGYEALAILREDPATAGIPVMALSAGATLRDIQRGMQAGFLSYSTKPIKVREFMDEIDIALRYAAENHPGR
jgi:PAS domain S-box-containing protein